MVEGLRLGTWDTSQTLTVIWGLHLNHLLPLGGYVVSEQAAIWWVGYVILVSPKSQLDLDLGLLLAWVWV